MRAYMYIIKKYFSRVQQLIMYEHAMCIFIYCFLKTLIYSNVYIYVHERNLKK